MTELIDLAAALSTIYQYIYWEITDQDFIEITKDHYIKLPLADRDKTWYLINPFRLKKYHQSTLVVDENDKTQLLAATKLICAISQSLPYNASFRERLLYCKAYLPSCLYSIKYRA